MRAKVWVQSELLIINYPKLRQSPNATRLKGKQESKGNPPAHSLPIQNLEPPKWCHQFQALWQLLELVN